MATENAGGATTAPVRAFIETLVCDPACRAVAGGSIRRVAWMSGFALSREAEEDLVQDVLVRILERGTVCEPHARYAYIRRTAERVALDAIRRSRAWRRGGRHQAVDELPEVVSGEPGADARASERAEARRVFVELRALVGDRAAAIMVAAIVGEVPRATIARRLGCTRAAIDAVISRASAAVRRRRPMRGDGASALTGCSDAAG